MRFDLLLIPAALAGVVLPKVVPALALPRDAARLSRLTRLLPAATLGAFAALEGSAWAAARPMPWLAVAVLAVVVLIAALVRRTLVTLAAGAVALALLKVAGLG